MTKEEWMIICRGCGESKPVDDFTHINIVFGIISTSPYCGFYLCKECIAELRNRYNITDEELED